MLEDPCYTDHIFSSTPLYPFTYRHILRSHSHSNNKGSEKKPQGNRYEILDHLDNTKYILNSEIEIEEGYKSKDMPPLEHALVQLQALGGSRQEDNDVHLPTKPLYSLRLPFPFPISSYKRYNDEMD